MHYAPENHDWEKTYSVRKKTPGHNCPGGLLKTAWVDGAGSLHHQPVPLKLPLISVQQKYNINPGRQP